MIRRLLALYPRRWRDRYGAELAGLIDELISAGETTRLRAGLGLISGAALERWRAVTRRAVLVPAAAAVTAAGGVGLAVTSSLHGAAATRPYFDTHPIGDLLLVVVLVWLMTELVEVLNARQWLRPAVTAGRRGFLVAGSACLTATTLALHLAPAVVPAAAIRPGAAAFGIGLAIMVAGIVLRAWSCWALGRQFSFSIRARADQPVVTSGPYRVLRHPAYAGILLISAGLGLTSANWAGLAAMTVLSLAFVAWRIHVEEHLLHATIGDRYRHYAASHKRLVPLIW